MKRLLIPLWLVISMVFGTFASNGANDLELTGDGFIPVEVLFRETDHAGVTISPDGKFIAGTRWDNWLKNRYRLVTFSFDLESREIRVIHRGMDGTWARWFDFASDGDLLVRFYHGALYRISPSGEDPDFLISSPTATNKVNAHLTTSGILDTLPSDPEHIMLFTGINGEQVAGISEKYLQKKLGSDDPIGGVWKLNIRTGESTQVMVDDRNTDNWWLTPAGEVRLALSYPEADIERDGTFEDERWYNDTVPELYLIEDSKFGRKLPIEHGPVYDDDITQFAGPLFSKSGETLYYLSQLQTDTTSIMSMDLQSLEVKVLKTDPEGDITSLLKDPYEQTLIGYQLRTGKGRTVFFDPGLEAIQKSMEQVFPGEYAQLRMWDRNYEKFLVFVKGDKFPGKYYLYDRIKGTLEPVFDQAPWLDGYQLASMSVIKYTARDGLEIEGYLTLPADKRAKAPYPMILYVHGGPNARDSWGFDPMVQFLANRGYAVLQVNFRGSTGYGLQFMKAGFKQWGRAMQDDLSDAVKWAVAQGHADPGRVTIMGASYGGYATMAGLAFTPELYQAGIAMMGRYDLTKRADELGHYYGEDLKWIVGILRERLGDPETEFDLLREVSPIFHVDRIEDPVLVTHGQDDRQVRIDQSFDLVKRLRNAKKVHEKYFPLNVDHSFGWEEKRYKLAQEIENFLRKHMPSDLM